MKAVSLLSEYMNAVYECLFLVLWKSCTPLFIILQESHAAQLQILMEFLKVARRNKREVMCFVFFQCVRWCLLLSVTSFLFKWCGSLALSQQIKQGTFGEVLMQRTNNFPCNLIYLPRDSFFFFAFFVSCWCEFNVEFLSSSYFVIELFPFLQHSSPSSSSCFLLWWKSCKTEKEWNCGLS